MSRHKRTFQPLYHCYCVCCLRTFLSERDHARACSAKCRKRLSRGFPPHEVDPPVSAGHVRLRDVGTRDLRLGEP